MEEPAYLPRSAFEAVRGVRGFDARAEGLWTVGALEALARPCVAIVGTRAATPYGRRLAHDFAYALGSAGCCIVSGLALGIDAAAHQGALDARAPTVGVLGGGHGCFFPRRNRILAQRMVEAGGAVISPFPPEHPARPPQFLQRNGIVAALSDAVVVIEAPARSGALNTASWAAGRVPVLAVPGDVDRPANAGSLALIRDGAILARGPQDVLEALGCAGGRIPAAGRSAAAPADPAAAAILGVLAAGPANLDGLAADLRLPVPEILTALARLELAGLVEAREAATYARCAMLSECNSV